MLQPRQRINARKHRPDYSIVLITGLLLLIGIILIFSIGPAIEQSVGISVSKQFLSFGVGLIAFGITSYLPIKIWHRLLPILVVASLITTALLLVPGNSISPDVNGATRWLIIGSWSFQPSELLKFTLIIYLAALLAKRTRLNHINNAKQTFIPVLVIVSLIAFFIVVLQKDLGTMLVLTAIVISMLYISGIKFRYLQAMLAGMVAVGTLAVVLVPHRLNRLLTFISPNSDVEGAGYHINQALIAIGSGGVFGLGLEKGVQAYGYLPEAANDSIFAIYAEKFGFVGTILALMLFGFLMIKMVNVISRAPNTYMRLIATGVFAWIFTHIVINIGAMLNLLPLTGITLPFFSYGGSSLVFTMAGLGLVFNISRYTVFESSKGGKSENHSNRRRYRRSRLASKSRSKSS